MKDRIFVRREAEDRLGRITLQAGPLNVLGIDDVKHLAHAIRDLDDCAVVLLDAEGDRAFSAGMEVADHLPDRAHEMLAAVAGMAAAFRSAKPVTLAKVAAPALGGGFELVLLCDLAICSQRARFSLPEIKLGALPPIACELLPQAIGARRSTELMLTGRVVDAQTAERWGIVLQAVAHEQLDDAVQAQCSELLSMSATALTLCKRAIRACDTRKAVDIYTEELLQTDDATEGISAFLEKRAPAWRAQRQKVIRI